MDKGKLGWVEGRTADHCYILFERQLPHTQERVWQALTDPDELALWFPGFKAELHEGGTYNMWFNGGDLDGPAHVTGTVTAYQPPRLLGCGHTKFELTPQDSGCLLRFSDALSFDDPRSNEDLMNSVLGGWHGYLDFLEGALQGQAYDPAAVEFDYRTVAVAGRDEP